MVKIKLQRPCKNVINWLWLWYMKKLLNTFYTLKSARFEFMLKERAVQYCFINKSSATRKDWLRNSAGLFHFALIYMVDLHLVLPALKLSALDDCILIIVQQATSPNYSNIWIVRIIRDNTGTYKTSWAPLTGNVRWVIKSDLENSNAQEISLFNLIPSSLQLKVGIIVPCTQQEVEPCLNINK